MGLASNKGPEIAIQVDKGETY